MTILVILMVAKLILYPDCSTQEVCSDVVQLAPSNELPNWQLVAQNLTTGKLIDLLVCLDEFGFLNVEADSARVV